MNDFTKEELVYLFNELDHNCMRYQEPDIAYEIKDKIKSMIDNYCDHEFHLNLSSFPSKLQCVKCEIYYE